MKITKYPDGTSYIEASYKLKQPHITFKVNSYEDLWHLNQFVDALKVQKTRPIITIPNLIDAQADRRFGSNQSSGLKLVCEFLNKMEADFKIFHPHNPEVVEALMDNVEIINNSNFINEVLDYLANPYLYSIKNWRTELDNLVLMSPDAGAFKPLMSLCNKLNWKGETYSASKHRDYVTGETKLIQRIDRTDFNGKDVLIVDDICVYGGTFRGLVKMLKTRNVGKLYLAVTHLTVQNHKRDDAIFNYFDKVFTTNSKFDSYWKQNKKGEQIKPDNLTIIKQF